MKKLLSLAAPETLDIEMLTEIVTEKSYNLSLQ